MIIGIGDRRTGHGLGRPVGRVRLEAGCGQRCRL